MLETLKKQVCDANLKLVAQGLVVQTFGNVSGIDRQQGLVVIKPSGVSYDQMHPKQMVVVSLADGSLVEGDLRPSSDTPTHLELYRAFDGIGGVVHTHSVFATSWAQAHRKIEAIGTTHADYFYGPVPCTRPMRSEEIDHHYEANTGKVIVEHFTENDLDPDEVPGVLVASHGPFTWGDTPDGAVDCAVILEYIARLAAETVKLNPYPGRISDELMNRHFLRKHGAGKYYGQE
ncbi:MAG: L-ribulose-5-phosphate 4-epimerase AraD [Phycisphaerales bacterium]|jgi:L-ribulose-5-phosphate 4-epimerase|nr:L-ribulose-5-phosphate 4-epimerase AraD [Phycisphaerales bacterium]